MNMEEQVYKKNQIPALDEEFSLAASYGKVKLGKNYIFWKKGLRWHYLELQNVQRAFRRIEAVNAGLCCGKASFDIQKLVLILRNSTELDLVIGDAMPREAEKLYAQMQKQQQRILFGKP